MKLCNVCLILVLVSVNQISAKYYKAKSTRAYLKSHLEPPSQANRKPFQNTILSATRFKDTNPLRNDENTERVSSLDTSSQKGMYKMYNFPDIGYPIYNPSKNPLYFKTILNSDIFGVNKDYAPNIDVSRKINDLKKQKRMDRKLKRLKYEENYHAKREMPSLTKYTPLLEAFWLKDSQTFPEIQYPVTAMETWIPSYWNPPLFCQIDIPVSPTFDPQRKRKRNYLSDKQPVKPKIKQLKDGMKEKNLNLTNTEVDVINLNSTKNDDSPKQAKSENISSSFIGAPSCNAVRAKNSDEKDQNHTEMTNILTGALTSLDLATDKFNVSMQIEHDILSVTPIPILHKDLEHRLELKTKANASTTKTTNTTLPVTFLNDKVQCPAAEFNGTESHLNDITKSTASEYQDTDTGPWRVIIPIPLPDMDEDIRSNAIIKKDSKDPSRSIIVVDERNFLSGMQLPINSDSTDPLMVILPDIQNSVSAIKSPALQHISLKNPSTTDSDIPSSIKSTSTEYNEVLFRETSKNEQQLPDFGIHPLVCGLTDKIVQTKDNSTSNILSKLPVNELALNVNAYPLLSVPYDTQSNNVAKLSGDHPFTNLLSILKTRVLDNILNVSKNVPPVNDPPKNFWLSNINTDKTKNMIKDSILYTTNKDVASLQMHNILSDQKTAMVNGTNPDDLPSLENYLHKSTYKNTFSNDSSKNKVLITAKNIPIEKASNSNLISYEYLPVYRPLNVTGNGILSSKTIDSSNETPNDISKDNLVLLSAKSSNQIQQINMTEDLYIRNQLQNIIEVALQSYLNILTEKSKNLLDVKNFTVLVKDIQALNRTNNTIPIAVINNALKLFSNKYSDIKDMSLLQNETKNAKLEHTAKTNHRDNNMILEKILNLPKNGYQSLSKPGLAQETSRLMVNKNTDQTYDIVAKDTVKEDLKDTLIVETNLQMSEKLYPYNLPSDVTQNVYEQEISEPKNMHLDKLSVDAIKDAVRLFLIKFPGKPDNTSALSINKNQQKNLTEKCYLINIIKDSLQLLLNKYPSILFNGIDKKDSVLSQDRTNNAADDQAMGMVLLAEESLSLMGNDKVEQNFDIEITKDFVSNEYLKDIPMADLNSLTLENPDSQLGKEMQSDYVQQISENVKSVHHDKISDDIIHKALQLFLNRIPIKAINPYDKDASALSINDYQVQNITEDFFLVNIIKDSLQLLLNKYTNTFHNDVDKRHTAMTQDETSVVNHTTERDILTKETLPSSERLPEINVLKPEGIEVVQTAEFCPLTLENADNLLVDIEQKDNLQQVSGHLKNEFHDKLPDYIIKDALESFLNKFPDNSVNYIDKRNAEFSEDNMLMNIIKDALQLLLNRFMCKPVSTIKHTNLTLTLNEAGNAINRNVTINDNKANKILPDLKNFNLTENSQFVAESTTKKENIPFSPDTTRPVRERIKEDSQTVPLAWKSMHTQENSDDVLHSDSSVTTNIIKIALEIFLNRFPDIYVDTINNRDSTFSIDVSDNLLIDIIKDALQLFINKHLDNYCKTTKKRKLSPTINEKTVVEAKYKIEDHQGYMPKNSDTVPEMELKKDDLILRTNLTTLLKLQTSLDEMGSEAKATEATRINARAMTNVDKMDSVINEKKQDNKITDLNESNLSQLLNSFHLDNFSADVMRSYPVRHFCNHGKNVKINIPDTVIKDALQLFLSNLKCENAIDEIKNQNVLVAKSINTTHTKDASQDYRNDDHSNYKILSDYQVANETEFEQSEGKLLIMKMNLMENTIPQPIKVIDEGKPFTKNETFYDISTNHADLTKDKNMHPNTLPSDKTKEELSLFLNTFSDNSISNIGKRDSGLPVNKVENVTEEYDINYQDQAYKIVLHCQVIKVPKKAQNITSVKMLKQNHHSLADNTQQRDYRDILYANLNKSYPLLQLTSHSDKNIFDIITGNSQQNIIDKTLSQTQVTDALRSVSMEEDFHDIRNVDLSKSNPQKILEMCPKGSRSESTPILNTNQFDQHMPLKHENKNVPFNNMTDYLNETQCNIPMTKDDVSIKLDKVTRQNDLLPNSVDLSKQLSLSDEDVALLLNTPVENINKKEAELSTNVNLENNLLNKILSIPHYIDDSSNEKNKIVDFKGLENATSSKDVDDAVDSRDTNSTIPDASFLVKCKKAPKPKHVKFLYISL